MAARLLINKRIMRTSYYLPHKQSGGCDWQLELPVSMALHTTDAPELRFAAGERGLASHLRQLRIAPENQPARVSARQVIFLGNFRASDRRSRGAQARRRALARSRPMTTAP